MSIKLMNQVWELDLSHDKQNILIAMADHANDDGVNCFPGVDYLAWKCGYDRRSIQRILRLLEDDGLISPLAFPEGGRGHATEYKIDVTRAKKKIPFEEFKRIQREKKGGNSTSFIGRKGGEKIGRAA